MKRLIKITLLPMLSIMITSCVWFEPPQGAENAISTESLLGQQLPSEISIDSPEPTDGVPVPNFSEDDLHILNLLAIDANCELPCFLGITPGKTLISDVQNLVEENSSIVAFNYDSTWSTPEIKIYNLSIRLGGNAVEEDLISMHFTIGVSEYDVIRYITGKMGVYRYGSLIYNFEYLSAHSLHQVFQRYGPPDIVYYALERDNGYRLHVVYDEEIVIALGGKSSQYPEMCPNIGDGDIGSMQILIMDGNDPIEMLTLFPYPFYQNDLPIEKSFMITLLDFYTKVIEENDICFPLE